jgi:hypothetical protein
MCGLAILATAAGVWSCNGDPTGDFRGQGNRIIADPSVVVLSQGGQRFVTLQQVDEQGNQQAVDFQLKNVGAGLTVVLDSTFLGTTINTHLSTQQRFIVSGSGLLNSSFTVQTGGDTLQIPVTVTPVEVAPTFSNTTPAQNEPITVTTPAGYHYLRGAFVSFGADPAVVLSRSADSTTLTVVPVPGPAQAYRTATIDSIQADYIPGIPLVLPTTDSVLIPLLAPVAGTGSTGSAPTIPTPAVGEVSALFDVGTFTGTDISSFDGGFSLGAQYYKFTLAEAGSVNITLNWTNTTPDLDLILCSDAACATEDDVAAGASQPESGDYNLAAGTYYIVVPFFPSTAPPLPPDLPPQISIIITRTS